MSEQDGGYVDWILTEYKQDLLLNIDVSSVSNLDFKLKKLNIYDFFHQQYYIYNQQTLVFRFKPPPRPHRDRSQFTVGVPNSYRKWPVVFSFFSKLHYSPEN